MRGRDLAPRGSVRPPFLQHAGPDFFTWWVPRAAKRTSPTAQSFSNLCLHRGCQHLVGQNKSPDGTQCQSEQDIQSNIAGLQQWGLGRLRAIFAAFMVSLHAKRVCLAP